MLTVRRTQSGFSLIELIIVMVIAAIFAAIALPNLADTMVRGDLTQAQANVSQAFRKAKNEARGRNTNVAVAFINGASALTLTSADGGLVQNILLPSTVTVTSANATFTFTSLGTVDALGAITLTSSRDGAQTRTITIASLLGQITAS